MYSGGIGNREMRFLDSLGNNGRVNDAEYALMMSEYLEHLPTADEKEKDTIVVGEQEGLMLQRMSPSEQLAFAAGYQACKFSPHKHTSPVSPGGFSNTSPKKSFNKELSYEALAGMPAFIPPTVQQIPVISNYMPIVSDLSPHTIIQNCQKNDCVVAETQSQKAKFLPAARKEDSKRTCILWGSPKTASPQKEKKSRIIEELRASPNKLPQPRNQAEAFELLLECSKGDGSLPASPLKKEILLPGNKANNFSSNSFSLGVTERKDGNENFIQLVPAKIDSVQPYTNNNNTFKVDILENEKSDESMKKPNEEIRSQSPAGIIERTPRVLEAVVAQDSPENGEPLIVVYDRKSAAASINNQKKLIQQQKQNELIKIPKNVATILNVSPAGYQSHLQKQNQLSVTPLIQKPPLLPNMMMVNNNNFSNNMNFNKNMSLNNHPSDQGLENRFVPLSMSPLLSQDTKVLSPHYVSNKIIPAGTNKNTNFIVSTDGKTNIITTTLINKEHRFSPTSANGQKFTSPPHGKFIPSSRWAPIIQGSSSHPSSANSPSIMLPIHKSPIANFPLRVLSPSVSTVNGNLLQPHALVGFSPRLPNRPSSASSSHSQAVKLKHPPQMQKGRGILVGSSAIKSALIGNGNDSHIQRELMKRDIELKQEHDLVTSANRGSKIEFANVMTFSPKNHPTSLHNDNNIIVNGKVEKNLNAVNNLSKQNQFSTLNENEPEIAQNMPKTSFKSPERAVAASSFATTFVEDDLLVEIARSLDTIIAGSKNNQVNTDDNEIIALARRRNNGAMHGTSSQGRGGLRDSVFDADEIRQIARKSAEDTSSVSSSFFLSLQTATSSSNNNNNQSRVRNVMANEDEEDHLMDYSTSITTSAIKSRATHSSPKENRQSENAHYSPDRINSTPAAVARKNNRQTEEDRLILRVRDFLAKKALEPQQRSLTAEERASYEALKVALERLNGVFRSPRNIDLNSTDDNNIDSNTSQQQFAIENTNKTDETGGIAETASFISKTASETASSEAIQSLPPNLHDQNVHTDSQSMVATCPRTRNLMRRSSMDQPTGSPSPVHPTNTGGVGELLSSAPSLSLPLMSARISPQLSNSAPEVLSYLKNQNADVPYLPHMMTGSTSLKISTEMQHLRSASSPQPSARVTSKVNNISKLTSPYAKKVLAAISQERVKASLSLHERLVEKTSFYLTSQLGKNLSQEQILKGESPTKLYSHIFPELNDAPCITRRGSFPHESGVAGGQTLEEALWKAEQKERSSPVHQLHQMQETIYEEEDEDDVLDFQLTSAGQSQLSPTPRKSQHSKNDSQYLQPNNMDGIAYALESSTSLTTLIDLIDRISQDEFENFGVANKINYLQNDTNHVNNITRPNVVPRLPLKSLMVNNGVYPKGNDTKYETLNNDCRQLVLKRATTDFIPETANLDDENEFMISSHRNVQKDAVVNCIPSIASSFKQEDILFNNESLMNSGNQREMVRKKMLDNSDIYSSSSFGSSVKRLTSYTSSSSESDQTEISAHMKVDSFGIEKLNPKLSSSSSSSNSSHEVGDGENCNFRHINQIKSVMELGTSGIPSTIGLTARPAGGLDNSFLDELGEASVGDSGVLVSSTNTVINSETAVASSIKNKNAQSALYAGSNKFDSRNGSKTVSISTSSNNMNRQTNSQQFIKSSTGTSSQTCSQIDRAHLLKKNRKTSIVNPSSDQESRIGFKSSVGGIGTDIDDDENDDAMNEEAIKTAFKLYNQQQSIQHVKQIAQPGPEFFSIATPQESRSPNNNANEEKKSNKFAVPGETASFTGFNTSEPLINGQSRRKSLFSPPNDEQNSSPLIYKNVVQNSQSLLAQRFMQTPSPSDQSVHSSQAQLTRPPLPPRRRLLLDSVETAVARQKNSFTPPTPLHEDNNAEKNMRVKLNVGDTNSNSPSSTTSGSIGRPLKESDASFSRRMSIDACSSLSANNRNGDCVVTDESSYGYPNAAARINATAAQATGGKPLFVRSYIATERIQGTSGSALDDERVNGGAVVEQEQEGEVKALTSRLLDGASKLNIVNSNFANFKSTDNNKNNTDLIPNDRNAIVKNQNDETNENLLKKYSKDKTESRAGVQNPPFSSISSLSEGSLGHPASPSNSLNNHHSFSIANDAMSSHNHQLKIEGGLTKENLVYKSTLSSASSLSVSNAAIATNIALISAQNAVHPLPLSARRFVMSPASSSRSSRNSAAAVALRSARALLDVEPGSFPLLNHHSTSINIFSSDTTDHAADDSLTSRRHFNSNEIKAVNPEATPLVSSSALAVNELVGKTMYGSSTLSAVDDDRSVGRLSSAANSSFKQKQLQLSDAGSPSYSKAIVGINRTLLLSMPTPPFSSKRTTHSKLSVDCTSSDAGGGGVVTNDMSRRMKLLTSTANTTLSDENRQTLISSSSQNNPNSVSNNTSSHRNAVKKELNSIGLIDRLSMDSEVLGTQLPSAARKSSPVSRARNRSSIPSSLSALSGPVLGNSFGSTAASLGEMRLSGLIGVDVERGTLNKVGHQKIDIRPQRARSSGGNSGALNFSDRSNIQFRADDAFKSSRYDYGIPNVEDKQDFDKFSNIVELGMDGSMHPISSALGVGMPSVGRVPMLGASAH